jgi:hypothetical protein
LDVCGQGAVLGHAMTYNFRTIVALAAHGANLFDIEQKYADVMESEAIVASLRALAPA